MNIELPLKNFAAIKVISGLFILALGVIYPMTVFVTLAILAVGKAHSVGAYLGMWRAGKLNTKLVTWIAFVTIVVSYLGVMVLDFRMLWLFSILIFVFHFIYDEIELQQANYSLKEVFVFAPPFLLLASHVYLDFTSSSYPILVLVAGFLCLTLIEFFFISTINWSYIQAKILSVFALSAMYFGLSAEYTVSITLLYHYLYWFIFPTYKLYKHKREEVAGFVMILFIITLTSVFIYSTRVWAVQDVSDELAMRSFFIASTIHVLTTAPFAYLFGLSKPKYDA